jgi:histidinol-phosphate aminotransferase
MSPFANGSINAIVKWGGVAALKDTATQARTRKNILALRKKVTGELTTLGYSVIPSEANFFMVHVRRDITRIIDEFEKKGVLVGRKFPPMVDHLRVSVGTPDEMDRFMACATQISSVLDNWLNLKQSCRTLVACYAKAFRTPP